MIEVGIKTFGKSRVEAVDGIKFIKCVTWKELARHEICLIENCKDEDYEKVLELKGKIYSLGGCGKEIIRITNYINGAEEILGETKAIQTEKQRSIEEIKKVNKERKDAEEEKERIVNQNATLQERLQEKTHRVDVLEGELEKTKKELDSTKEKLDVVSELNKKNEEELNKYKKDLGNTIIQNRTEKETLEEKLNEEKESEIRKINEILMLKDEEIKKQEGKILNLEYKIKELSKSGTIPEIIWRYKGDAKIITVVSHGSYGCSNLAYTISNMLEGNTLLVDFDTKGGNIKDYVGKEVYSLEEMVKTGKLERETLLKTMKGNHKEYIGGFKNIVKPNDIVMLDFDTIFEGDYNYIIIDLGIVGGYNIQTTLFDTFIKNGNIINIHVGREIRGNNIYNIRNFNKEGIPKILDFYGSKKSFIEEPILKFAIEKRIHDWTK